MLNGVRERLTFANVIATCALFVALGGGAYALEGRNTVDAGDLKKNAVKPPEIAKNAVKKAETAQNSIGTGEVINRSLLERDFAPGQLPAGLQGPQGEPGAPGQDGEDATKLFGYILDVGDDAAAVVHYGSGVTDVTDQSGHNPYTVTFNQSVANCVVMAEAGAGNPSDTNISLVASSRIVMPVGNDSQVSVEFQTATGTATDTAFMIAAFC
jgi:hypothetical protein